MSSRKAGLSFILITLVLDILGIGIIVPIFPQLLKELSGGDTASAASMLGWFSALYALMQFIFSPILGSLSDKVGRRPVLLISLLGSGLNYLVLAFAPSLGWLVLSRLIAGGTAASIGTCTAAIADVTPPEKRAQSFGLVGMAFGLGFVVGPGLGALLGGINVRLPFLVAAGLSLLNVAYGLFVLPESLKPENRRAFSWERANPFATLSELKRTPVVFGLATAQFFAEVAQRGLESMWVLYAGYRYGWNIRQVGLSLAAVGLSQAAIQGGLVRRIVPALGEKRSILLGLSIAATAFVAYGLAWQGWMMLVIIPLGSFSGIAPPAASAIMSRCVPPNEQGLLQGALSSLRSITMIIGPFIAGHLFAYFISPGAPVQLPGISFFWGALLILVALALTVRVLSKLELPPLPVAFSGPAPAEAERPG